MVKQKYGIIALFLIKIYTKEKIYKNIHTTLTCVYKNVKM